MNVATRPAPSSRPAAGAWAAMAIAFYDMVGIGVILPNLPSIGYDFGLPAFGLAVLVSVFPGAQVITSPLFGRLSDRFPPALLLALTTLAAGASYLGFAATNNVTVLFGFRILAGAMAGNVPVAQSLLVRSAPADVPEVVLGRFGMAQNLGFISGLLIGSLAALPGVSGRSPLWIAGAVGLVLGLGILGASRRIDRETRFVNRPDGSVAPPTAGLASPWLALAAFLLVAATYTATSVFLPVAATELFRWAGPQIAGLYVLNSLVSAFTRLRLIKPIGVRLGGPRAKTLALTGMIVSALVLAAAGHLQPVFLSAIVLLVFCTAVAQTFIIGGLVAAAPAAAHGRILGLAMACMSVGTILGPPLSGGLHDLAGIAPAYFGIALVALAALVLVKMADRRTRTSDTGSPDRA